MTRPIVALLSKLRSGAVAAKAVGSVAAVLVVLAAGCGVHGAHPASSGAQLAPARRLVFADEFRGSSLNHRKWTTCYWWNNGGCTNVGNKEKQWYLPQNVRVSRGALHLVTRRKTVRGTDGVTYPYSSGMVTTGRARENHTLRPRFAFTYGRVAARMRAPSGRGLWSALWLLPLSQQSRPEIDVIEILGHQPRRLHVHFHYVQDGQDKSVGRGWMGAHVSRRWHVYSVDWSPRKIVWSVDGRAQLRFTRVSSIPHEPMYMLFNLAVGGEWPGDPTRSTPFPSSVDVDYVRVWQRGR